MDTSDNLFCNGYSVKPLNTLTSYKIENLQVFLQSRFMHAYALATSFEIAGGYQCYQKNFIEKICLPPESITEMAAYDNQAFEIAACNFYGIELKNLDELLSFYTNSSFN